MLDNIVRLAGYKLHLEKAKCRMNAVEFVHNRLYLFVFLLDGLATVNESNPASTHVHDHLTDDVLIWQIFSIEIHVC